jgi:hypothetical protein
MQEAEQEDNRYDEEMEKLQKRKADEETERKANEGAGSDGTAKRSDDTIVRRMGNFNIRQLRQKTPNTGYVKSKGKSSFQKYTPTYEEMAKRKEMDKRYGIWYNKESKRLHDFIVGSFEGETEEIRNTNRAAATMAGEKIQRAEKIRNWRANQRAALIRTDQDIKDEEVEILANRAYWLKEVISLEEAKREMWKKRQESLEQEIERVSRIGVKGGAGTSKEQVEPPPNPAPDPVADQEMEEEEEEEGDKDQYQYKSTEDSFY